MSEMCKYIIFPHSSLPFDIFQINITALTQSLPLSEDITYSSGYYYILS